jgi:hypothetical protein
MLPSIFIHAYIRTEACTTHNGYIHVGWFKSWYACVRTQIYFSWWTYLGLQNGKTGWRKVVVKVKRVQSRDTHHVRRLGRVCASVLLNILYTHAHTHTHALCTVSGHGWGLTSPVVLKGLLSDVTNSGPFVRSEVTNRSIMTRSHSCKLANINEAQGFLCQASCFYVLNVGVQAERTYSWL